MASRLGTYLRSVREARGVGLKRAAPDIGLSYSYLSKLENGLVAPSEDTLERLADYYDVNPEMLGVLAGRLPADVLEILQNDPEAAVKYLRERFGSV